ncbi:MAG: gliding motility-associated C-terminal domain-containing protein [Bacteroidota bacterium]
MKKSFITFLFLISFPVVASHIVGGEFELLHISGYQYRLNLIIYFDKINGSPGAKDQGGNSPRASIYRKSDNVFMREVFLTLTTESSVEYTQPECSNGEIITDRLFYTADVILLPEEFGDPEGYYVVWQRCCRNYQIANIFSNEPVGPNDPNAAGQTFYLEFPAVVKDGNPFINSSPRLFPPLNDYACPQRPYYVDFAGVDDDGDSLYYSLVTPLNTVNSAALPPVSPLPYPEVRWKPGFSLDRIMKGSPDLNISNEGLLRVTPTLQGLFVFAVKVEEFRNKLKIGESRRDFQMLVVDNCSPASPPQILGKKLTDPFFTDNSMSVSFANTVSNADRCIQVSISDPDSEKADDNFTEKIKIKVIGLNFKSDELDEILPPVVTGTLQKGESKVFKICFPKCPYFIGGPYDIGIIAMDDACSLPLLDTLKVSVNVEPPPNSDPYFTTDTNTFDLLDEGAQKSWPFEIKDDDLDELLVSPLTNGFLLEPAGMEFTIISQQPGLVNGMLSWDAYCDLYDFTQRTSFQVKIRVEDNDECEANEPVFAVYNLSVKLPGNADPVLDTDLTAAVNERTIFGLERKVGEALSFDVFGRDLVDNDLLTLVGVGKGFNLSDYSMAFLPASDSGTVQSKFQWLVSCDDFSTFSNDKIDSLNLQFIVVDNSNKCQLFKADTVDVSVKIFPPDNAAPNLKIRSLNPNVTLTNNQLTATLPQQISLGLLGIDADTSPSKDLLKLTLINVEGTVPLEGFTFTPVEGTSPLETTWVWDPDCTVFQNGIYENDYTLTFRIADDRCFTATADTVKISMKVRDADGTDENFFPVNFFSPNEDGVNDYYSMEVKDVVTGEFINMLPLDNCTAQFQGIRIYNRWGNQVFESIDRDFRWHAKGEAAGVYYYYVKYTHKEYKGALSIRY